MPPLKAIKWRELVFYLKKAGFEGPFPGGKHQYMVKDNLKLTIPNPHQGDVSISLLTRVLKRAKINKDDWEKL
ncbi:MAG: type II toxin-antitoxin system HicA family toxin [Crocosphaera sp.]|nr:type II toxin-antitoxin system HicA family toxin [Crocosphaera sp.]